MSFVHNTQIIWTSSINVNFNSTGVGTGASTGTGTSPLGTPFTLSFSPTVTSLPQNQININGSGNAGKFIGSHSTQPTKGLTSSFINNLIFQGSGGGNLSGNPEVIYTNLTGSLRVFSPELYSQTASLLTESSILEFTATCQIIISCDVVTLKFVNQYAEVYLQNSPLTTPFKIIFNSNETFNIQTGSTSVIVANNTRYINIGQFGITFTLS